MNHFCRLLDPFIPGQGKRFVAHCTTCGWKSQSHRTREDANADYSQHVEVSS